MFRAEYKFIRVDEIKSIKDKPEDEVINRQLKRVQFNLHNINDKIISQIEYIFTEQIKTEHFISIITIISKKHIIEINKEDKEVIKY